MIVGFIKFIAIEMNISTNLSFCLQRQKSIWCISFIILFELVHASLAIFFSAHTLRLLVRTHKSGVNDSWVYKIHCN